MLAKLTFGHWADRMARCKPVLVAGYLVTAVGTACFVLATAAWHVLAARATAWLGRGARTPVRKAMLAAAVTPETYGRAFGFARMMDTLGALVGTATTFVLLQWFGLGFREEFFWTLLPGLIAVAVIVLAVREKVKTKASSVSFRDGLRQLPVAFRRFLIAVWLFGADDFAHTLLILFAGKN